MNGVLQPAQGATQGGAQRRDKFSTKYERRITGEAPGFTRDGSHAMEAWDESYGTVPPVSTIEGNLLDGSSARRAFVPGNTFIRVEKGTPGAIDIPGLGLCLVRPPHPGFAAGTQLDQHAPAPVPVPEALAAAKGKAVKKGRKTKAQLLGESLDLIAKTQQEHMMKSLTEPAPVTADIQVTFHLPMPGNKVFKVSGKFSDVIREGSFLVLVQPTETSEVEIPVMEDAFKVQYSVGGVPGEDMVTSYGIQFTMERLKLRFMVFIVEDAAE